VVISSFELPEQSPETISNAGLFCTIISYKYDIFHFAASDLVRNKMNNQSLVDKKKKIVEAMNK